MKIRIVFSHFGNFSSGHQTWQRAQRERQMCEALNAHGHDCMLYFLAPPDDSWTSPEDPDSSFFLVDELLLGNPRYAKSLALLRQLERDRVDILLFKGLGYYLNGWVVAHLSYKPRVFLVVGGSLKDPLLKYAEHVFLEYETQPVVGARSASVLPKLVEPIVTNETAKNFDIINIGDFILRKNQRALVPFFHHYHVALVGDGPELAEIRSLAESKRDNIAFFGVLPRAEVLDLLQRSRIMVHTATQEGFPRVFSEAMMCGVPIVAFRKVGTGIIRDGEDGVLTDPENFVTDVTRLLSDEMEVHRLSQNCRIRALNEFSLHNLVDIVLARFQPHSLFDESANSFVRKLCLKIRLVIWLWERETVRAIRIMKKTWTQSAR